MLAALSAAVPVDAHILDIGTGAGVSAAWLVAGVGPRTDVRLTTVDNDEAVIATARQLDWPPWVDVVLADGRSLLTHDTRFDLIFADADPGKWSDLDAAISCLADDGVYVVDDLGPSDIDPVKSSRIARVRAAFDIEGATTRDPARFRQKLGQRVDLHVTEGSADGTVIARRVG